MELFGFPIQSVYLTILITSGVLTLFYILFGDIMDGIGEGIPILNPTLILVFFIFLSASGYIFEAFTSVSSVLIFIFSALGSIFLTTLLNIFVLVPLSSAEESLAYTEDSLKGRLGTAIISIPKDGFGEVLIENNSGRIAKSAVSFDKTEIAEGTKVLVIDVKEGVLFVRPYDERSLYSS